MTHCTNLNCLDYILFLRLALMAARVAHLVPQGAHLPCLQTDGRHQVAVRSAAMPAEGLCRGGRPSSEALRRALRQAVAVPCRVQTLRSHTVLPKVQTDCSCAGVSTCGQDVHELSCRVELQNIWLYGSKDSMN